MNVSKAQGKNIEFLNCQLTHMGFKVRELLQFDYFGCVW